MVSWRDAGESQTHHTAGGGAAGGCRLISFALPDTQLLGGRSRQNRWALGDKHSILEAGEVVQFAGAVAQSFRADVHAVEQRQVQIRDRGLALVDDMVAGLQCSGAAARKQYRQVLMKVTVAVAQAAAIYDHRMIQQSSVAVRSRL